MAQKVRTPPPRRRVQAPQRRVARKPAETRSPWLYAAAGAGVVAILAAAAIGFIVVRDDGGGTETKAASTNYNALQGIRRTKAPWPPEYEFLADRLLPLGLSPLPEEGAATHVHAHLDIFVNGKRATVPANLGINPGAGWMTELHTHDPTGLIHIESPEANDEFTLGQFLAEWAVFLDSRCVGAYCNGLTWYVDGKQETGNPANLVLKPHAQIALVVGKRPKSIPASYKFPPGT